MEPTLNCNTTDRIFSLKIGFAVFILSVVMIAPRFAVAQNNAIVLNGAFVKLDGGTVGTKVFLVVNQSSTAGIARNSGHIISENQYNYVRWVAGTGTGTYVYPFGYSTTDYLPVTLNKTTAGSATIDASTWGTDNKNMPHAGPSDGGTLGATFKMRGVGDSISSVIDRWWDFYPSGALTANLTFSYRGVENSTTSNTGDNLDMQHWNGSYWDPPVTGSTTGVTSGIGTLSVNNVTAFSPMVIIHRLGSLPVSLFGFNTACAENGIAISWSTASEANSDYFNLERSQDGVNFKPIAKIKAAGNSKDLLKYNFLDRNGFRDAYYRLKEVDFDGAVTFSHAVHAGCNSVEFGDAIRIFPNPVSDVINYTTNSEFNGPVTVEIQNQNGQSVIRAQYNLETTFVIPPTDVSALVDGFYYAKITHADKTFVLKFIKIKR